MTTWMIGHYPTSGKRPSPAPPVTDRLDQYNLGDGNGGAAAAAARRGSRPKRWSGCGSSRRSPTPAKIKTPTLIMSDTGDYRVPITQSYKLYHALKDNGVTTKFIAYPIPGHNANDPVRARDVQRRWVAWLQQYPERQDRHAVVRCLRF